MTARRRHREQRWPADYRSSYRPSYPLLPPPPPTPSSYHPLLPPPPTTPPTTPPTPPRRAHRSQRPRGQAAQRRLRSAKLVSLWPSLGGGRVALRRSAEAAQRRRALHAQLLRQAWVRLGVDRGEGDEAGQLLRQLLD